MKVQKKQFKLLAAMCAASFMLSGIPVHASVAIKTPQASGATVYSNQKATIDASNLSDGYVMIKYTGDAAGKIKVIIEKDTAYTYTLKEKNTYAVFPLTEGNGTYKVTVFEAVAEGKYAVAYGTTVTLSLTNELSPFLFPNQYVNFNAQSQTIATADSIVSGLTEETEKVTAIYDYVVSNVAYDFEKAKTVQSGYLPNVDTTLSTKKGICFDYAAVMTAMLRSQGIPTKLIIGYAGDIYHAWISVYIKDVGWVNNVIYFDGTKWTIMDPTFASTSKNEQYVPDEKSYAAKFAY